MALALKKLVPALEDWHKAGLIDAKQREAILRFERARAKAFNPMAWLAAAGGLCVILGIILLVSHNWENLGPPLQASLLHRWPGGPGPCH